MNAPRDLAAVWADLSAASLTEAAATTGETVGHVALRRMRATLAQRHDMHGQAWRSLPLDLRAMLITMAAPELDDAHYSARQPWGSFTEDQRGAIGAYARWLVSNLKGAAPWLIR